MAGSSETVAAAQRWPLLLLRFKDYAITGMAFDHQLIEMPVESGHPKPQPGPGFDVVGSSTVGSLTFVWPDGSLRTEWLEPRRIWRGYYSADGSCTRFESLADKAGRALIESQTRIPVPSPYREKAAVTSPAPEAILPLMSEQTHGTLRWLCCLHWLAWSGQCPMLKAEQWTWNGRALFPYNQAQRMAMRGQQLDDADVPESLLGTIPEDEHPSYRLSVLRDVPAASIAAIEWVVSLHELGNELGDPEWKSARWFVSSTGVRASTLREASREFRKTKRVRKCDMDGDSMYSAADARRVWPALMPPVWSSKK